MSNRNLHRAREAKNDEFYTQYADIQNEVNAYVEYNKDVFRDKTILLPCDDPEWSNFTKFFAQNFERFGLKKLISTSYAFEKKSLPEPYQISMFEQESPQYDAEKTQTHGKIFTLTRDKDNSGKINVNDLEWEYLEGDGDFRSDEVKKLRDEADIIVTNPPFSLFRQFMKWIMEAGKKFLIIGNQNAITYKEMFPLIKDNKVWLGHSYGSHVFRVPITNEGDNTFTKDGQKYAQFGDICWFTNLDHGLRRKPLKLMTEAENIRYSKHDKVSGIGYKKYDNYDAIEVPHTDAIPSDYDGVMGVPLSFLHKYCPEQFEILGCTQRECHDAVPDTKKYDDYWEVTQAGVATGSSGNKTNENAVVEGDDGKHNYFINKAGCIVHSLYTRIFIKRKTP